MTRSAKGSIEEPGGNVSAKAALNRRMRDAGFGQLHRLIAEKAEEAARRVVLVDARVQCGFSCHADVNAALVIRGRAQLCAERMPDAGADPVTQHEAA
jgi:putative transposase